MKKTLINSNTIELLVLTISFSLNYSETHTTVSYQYLLALQIELQPQTSNNHAPCNENRANQDYNLPILVNLCQPPHEGQWFGPEKAAIVNS